MTVKNFLRPNLRTFQAYSSAGKSSKRQGVLLDANELPSALSDSTREYNRYPHPLAIELRRKLASLHALDASQIFIGNGSDETFDLLQRAFCAPSVDGILVLPPTFGMYAVCAQLNDLAVHEVPLLPETFAVDSQRLFETIKACQPRIVYLCSPNNPTGNLLELGLIELVCQQMQAFGVVVLDEAYIDFSQGPSGLELLQQYSNLIVSRTLSKSWGLAGLRLGYCLASSEIIEVLDMIKPPYNINSSSSRLAMEVLDRQEQRAELLLQIKQERQRFTDFLRSLTYVERVFPSEANFILFKVRDADALYQNCLLKNVVLRKRSQDLHCQNCVRITIGSVEEMEYVREVFKAF